MRVSLVFLLLGVVIAAGAVLAAGSVLLAPPRPLIGEAGFAPATISPNADGVDDVTVFSYALARPAVISVTLTGEDGRIFVFREQQQRDADRYSVLFSGVVDGYLNEGERIQGDVERRLIPNGRYTWRLYAETVEGETDERSGELVVMDGEATLPEIVEFTLYPNVFTPNQDGISDRSGVNIGLSQPAELAVYLEREGMEPIYIPQRLETFDPDAAVLRYFYDYDGGVDLGADPPPDGEYILVASAQDEVGQRVTRMASLIIQNGGRPQAHIVPQPAGATVVFEPRPFELRYLGTADARGELIEAPEDPQSLNLNTITMTVGDLLVFKLTVENYGTVPIRTAGSPPGTVFDWNQRASTFGEYDQSGAWRVGIDCDTATSDYPWRWAIGTEDNLNFVTDPNDGITYAYLPPGARSVVWGAVRMSEIEARNPQNCWAGLIHEDVAVSEFNRFVGPRRIELIEADAVVDS